MVSCPTWSKNLGHCVHCHTKQILNFNVIVWNEKSGHFLWKRCSCKNSEYVQKLLLLTFSFVFLMHFIFWNCAQFLLARLLHIWNLTNFKLKTFEIKFYIQCCLRKSLNWLTFEVATAVLALWPILLSDPDTFELNSIIIINKRNAEL